MLPFCRIPVCLFRNTKKLSSTGRDRQPVQRLCCGTTPDSRQVALVYWSKHNAENNHNWRFGLKSQGTPLPPSPCTGVACQWREGLTLVLTWLMAGGLWHLWEGAGVNQRSPCSRNHCSSNTASCLFQRQRSKENRNLVNSVVLLNTQFETKFAQKKTKSHQQSCP